jgi:hypothetical protein
MKAFWHNWKQGSILKASRFARTFETSLAKKWTKLIGLKSTAISKTLFSGMRIIATPLSFSRGIEWLCRQEKDRIMSGSMIGQQIL